jgi:hypothetical protein
VLGGTNRNMFKLGFICFFNILLASLPLLVGILFVYNNLCSLCLFLLCGNNFFSGSLFYILIFFFFFAFSVEMPTLSFICGFPGLALKLLFLVL